jgi:hypothetical protein
LNDLQTVVVQTGTDVRTVGTRVDALQAHVNNLVIPARQPITGTGVLKVLGGIALGVVAVKGTNIAMEMACEGSDSTLCDDKKAAKLIKDTVTEKGRKAIAALDDAATTARREFGSK